VVAVQREKKTTGVQGWCGAMAFGELSKGSTSHVIVWRGVAAASVAAAGHDSERGERKGKKEGRVDLRATKARKSEGTMVGKRERKKEKKTGESLSLSDHKKEQRLSKGAFSDGTSEEGEKKEGLAPNNFSFKREKKEKGERKKQHHHREAMKKRRGAYRSGSIEKEKKKIRPASPVPERRGRGEKGKKEGSAATARAKHHKIIPTAKRN